jgi:hypothetical protein|tara:strand:+ start:1659 stop:3635 length:1977 start_codon:yes stop_codon:yes gene_type:complete
MKKITNAKMSWLLLSIILVIFPNTSFSQTPNGTVNLGILESFEGYTGAGAITNAAGATWTGDAGTNIGAFSGFDAPSFIGNTYSADAVTAQCRLDLLRVYIHLNDLFVDYPATHAPAFGAGETITPGVYSIPSAGSIGGILTLDGGGDFNAFFVIKYYGALTVGAGAVLNLTGGTQSCNVFFIAQGEISVAANANIKGTLFAKIGAVGLGAGTVLEGRMLSLEGAITAGIGATVNRPPGTCTIQIFYENSASPAAAVDVLGVLSDYVLYTNLGALSNTSTSGINGEVGTNSGIVSGFASSIVIKDIHTTDASTAQANIDLDDAYNSLMAIPNTVTSHPAVFGSVAPGGETINAGVYFINGAGSLLGTLVLNGQNDPDAIFVFKFAGAFSVAAQAKMILINGARRYNVFFIGGAGVATGAISIGAGATLKGTFLSHGGAVGSGASTFLAGRQLSTGGLVSTYSGIIYNNPEKVTSTPIGVVLPIELLSFTNKCNNQNIELNWRTATEIDNDYFSIERSIDVINWELVTKVDGAGNSPSINTYSYIDVSQYHDISYYRLKQTDFDGEFNNSAIITTEKCGEDIIELAIYPNPVIETLNLSYKGDKSQILSTLIYNLLGEIVYYSEFYQSKIVFENKLNDVYFIHVNTTSKNSIEKFIVVN